jgi:hypothetical protein
LPFTNIHFTRGIHWMPTVFAHLALVKVRAAFLILQPFLIQWAVCF